MPATKNNLLIVEDDAQLRILLATILAQSGYRVRAAEDGFSALEQIRAEMPDLVLSDLYMSGMSGFELLSVLRRRFPGISVIAMSSAFSAGEIPPGVAADAFYQKASGVAPLLSIIDETAGLDDLLPDQRPRDSAPIWIATHPQSSGPEEHVVIACPECLRTSAYAPDAASTVVRTTDCDYCHTPIDYAIVETADPGLPKTLRRHATLPASDAAAA
jgi:CheY-like chemotaxis protein